MKCPVPDPQQPDVSSIRALYLQAIRRDNHVVANGPASCVDVNGNDFSEVVGLDLSPDVPLVNLIAQASKLFTRAGWSDDLWGLRGRWDICVCHPLPLWRHTSKFSVAPFCEISKNDEITGNETRIFSEDMVWCGQLGAAVPPFPLRVGGLRPIAAPRNGCRLNLHPSAVSFIRYRLNESFAIAIGKRLSARNAASSDALNRVLARCRAWVANNSAGDRDPITSEI